MEFIYLIVFQFLIFVIGGLIVSCFKIRIDKPFLYIFTCLSVGLFIPVIAYSLIKTGLISVNIITIPLILLFGISIGFKRPNLKLFSNQISKYYKHLIFLFIVSSLIYVWKYYYVFGHGGEFPLVINIDDFCHATRAMYFNFSGLETTNLNYISIPDGVEPFHYFEAWIIAFCQNFTGFSYWIVEQLIVYPIINGIIIVGVWSIVEIYSKKIRYYVISVFVIILSGFFMEPLREISFFEHIGQFANNTIDEHWGLKLSIVYVVILGFINIHLSGKKKYAFLLLMFLPIFSITLAPSIFCATVIIIVINYFTKYKWIGSDINIIYVLIPIIISVMILGFYKFFQPTMIQIEMPSGISAVLNEFNTIDKMKSKFIISAEKLIQAIILYFPFVLIGTIILFNFKKSDRFKSYMGLISASKILIIIALISLPFWSIFYFIFGSSEFFYYPTVPILNILSLLVLIIALMIFEKQFFHKILLSFCLISFLFYSYRSYYNYSLHMSRNGSNKYSDEYLVKVSNELKEIENKVGGKIEAEDELEFSDSFDVIGFYLMGLLNEPYSLVSLTRHDNRQYENKNEKKLSKSAPYFQYIEEQKINNTIIDYDQSMIDFLKKYRIKFIVISGNIDVPEKIIDITEDIIIDDKTNEKFVVLKY